MLSGPTTIDHNLFLHPWGEINGAQVKLLSPSLHFPPPYNGPIRNITIRNNTFVGNWLCWWNESPVRGVSVHHNVFAVQRKKTPPWPDGVSEWANLYIDMPTSGFKNPGRDPEWLSNRRMEDDPAAACGATRPGERWTMKRPGPSWLDWQSLPATRSLLEDLDQELLNG